MHMLRKYGQEKDTKFMKVITSKEGQRKEMALEKRYKGDFHKF